ncbi:MULTISPECIES: hypothetical protein [unclassified Pseudoalteromonas]|nr:MULTISPECIES: hypothetical protein [unclassified Pseudoalteromonas]MDN3379774.1 hypothetical protein [Pseudoalteromonas sp. APC 3893]MDN3388100.1 hypothetical protein [Pseudoalteromonas sp. APC 4017]
MNRIHLMVEKLTSSGNTVHDEVDDIAKLNNQLTDIVGKFKLN